VRLKKDAAQPLEVVKKEGDMSEGFELMFHDGKGIYQAHCLVSEDTCYEGDVSFNPADCKNLSSDFWGIVTGDSSNSMEICPCGDYNAVTNECSHDPVGTPLEWVSDGGALSSPKQGVRKPALLPIDEKSSSTTTQLPAGGALTKAASANVSRRTSYCRTPRPRSPSSWWPPCWDSSHNS